MKFAGDERTAIRFARFWSFVLAYQVAGRVDLGQEQKIEACRNILKHVAGAMVSHGLLTIATRIDV